MVPVDQETNINVLRSYSQHLQKLVEQLARENQSLKDASEADKQAWLDRELSDKYTKLKEMYFGSGQEKLKNENRKPGHAGEQLALHGEHSNQSLEPKKENLPQGTTYHYKMSDRQLKNESVIRGIPVGAEAWEEIKGLYQTSMMVTVVERVYEQETHNQAKYRLLKKFNVAQKEVIVTAPGPVKLRAGSRYSVDFAVTTAVDKYEYHLPLERQRRQMEALGLNVEVKTLYGLCEAVSEHCAAILPKIKQEIMNDFCAVHVDESPWRILGSDRSAYMWVMSNRIGSIFTFEPSRSGDVALEILDGYRGAVLTDGFSGYNKLKNKNLVRVANCWAHARREFFDIRDAHPEDTTKVIGIIDDLFAIERKAKTFDELKLLRKTESIEVIKKLYDLLTEVKNRTLPRSGLAKAITYCLNRWNELTLFLEDLTVPLSNNDAERALRHVVMGRKNFAGSKSINGADVAANIYSVIESAKKAGLQPKVYLKYLIEERWFGNVPKTPQEYAREKLEPNNKVTFPTKVQWKIN